MTNETHLSDEQWAKLKGLALAKPEQKDEQLYAEAEVLARAHVQQHPANADYLYLLGMICFQQKKYDQAKEALEKAVVFAPNSSEILYNYALVLITQKKAAAALPLFRRVVRLKPDHAKAFYHIGNALKDLGDLPEAAEAYKKSLAIDPKKLEVLNNCGNVLKDLGKLDEAYDCYQAALALQPEHPLVLNNLGVVFFLQSKLDEAEALHQKALLARGDYPEALSNLGMIARLKGQCNEAIDYCQKALALRRAYPEAWNNLGNTYKDLCRFDEAIEAYHEALAVRPNDADVHNNLAMALLSLGRFDEGWVEQEWRWRSTQLGSSAPKFNAPLWEGEEGQGKTLLIHAEQGFGDTIQFCRYAPLVRDKGWRVLMTVPSPLKRLIETLDGVDLVLSVNDDPVKFDAHLPMMSLPLAFETREETIPCAVPYLKADPVDVAKWRARIEGLGQTGKRIGLVWSGSRRSTSPDLIATDKSRSLTPDVFAPIVAIKGCTFFSLQKEGIKAPESFGVIDWMDDSQDFADTAALVQNMDLVISVDTAMAHLAGAIGTPVWMLNRFNSCWRWMQDRQDSPWYPSMHIFRQKTLGVWDDVVDRVVQRIEAWR